MVDVEFLSTVSVFANLKPAQLEPLAGKLHPRHYHRGEVVFHQDDPADSMHIIVEGTVRISIASEDGHEMDIALLQPGECFGEMGLLDGSNRSATATAMEAANIITLLRHDFLDLLAQHPRVAADTASLLIRRLRHVNQMVGNMAFLDAPTRVAKELLQLAATYGGDTAWQDSVEIPLGQGDLARLVGVSRETVSRSLNSFRQLGILATSRRRITITDRKALERIASF